MTTVGYSGTPLPKKLGIKPGDRVRTLGAPPNLGEFLFDLPPGASISPRTGSTDIVLMFVKTRAQLDRRLAIAMKEITATGAIWTAWPKKSSGVPTEMGDAVLRRVILPNTPLVDNKVCALSEVWSGLRWVVRLEHRTSWG